jgi:hypothetical protein
MKKRIAGHARAREALQRQCRSLPVLGVAGRTSTYSNFIGAPIGVLAPAAYTACREKRLVENVLPLFVKITAAQSARQEGIP